MKDDLNSILRSIAVCKDIKKARGIALANLVDLHQATADKETAKLLAGIVSDTTESDNMRTASYFALFEVVGRPLRDVGPPQDFRFPDNVDWKFVDRYKHL